HGSFLVAGEVVRMPGHAFGGHLRVLAEKLECVFRGGGVVLLFGEFGGLDCGAGLVACAAIEDGELIVGCQVVGIDALQLLIGIACIGIIVLLIIREAKFAPAVLGAGIRGDHGLEIGDGF